MSSEIPGLEKGMEKLEDVAEKAKEIDGENNIPFDELRSLNFMQKNTKFDSIRQMIENNSFNVDSMESFAKIPDDQWDNFVAENTNFDNWKEMQMTAAKNWTSRKLEL